MSDFLDSDSGKLEVLRLNNDGYSNRKIASMVGVASTSIDRFLRRETYKTWWNENDRPIASGSIYDHYESIEKGDSQVYIVACAQNNTFVHKPFLKALEVAAARYDARILIGTCSYNKSGFQNLQKGDGDWFDPLITEYICDKPVQLAEDLVWCGELNILPTAVNPLSGLHSYAKSSSFIVPHVKLQLESPPRSKFEPPRFMYTTGSVTKRNYIQKKSGQKASFHHVFGALIVEVSADGKTWFVRQLNAQSSNGHFYDLDTLYTPDGYETGHRAEAINWGDLHYELRDDEVYDISFGKRKDSMLNWLKPKYQLMHDIIHFEARNHHSINDPYFRYKMFVEGKESVYDNVKGVADFLRYVSRDTCLTVIVESNHDQAMKRWLKDSDYKNDPINALYYLENQLDLYRAIHQGRHDYSVFENAIRKIYDDINIIFLKEDESFKIKGIECGSHGHRGNNGGRGSVLSFCKLGDKHNMGHTHAATIKDNVFCAGVTGKLDQGYNVGGTNWSHSHIVTYSNGKRTIVTIRNGKYTLYAR